MTPTPSRSRENPGVDLEKLMRLVSECSEDPISANVAAGEIRTAFEVLREKVVKAEMEADRISSIGAYWQERAQHVQKALDALIQLCDAVNMESIVLENSRAVLEGDA